METGGIAEHVVWGLDWKKQTCMSNKRKLLHRIKSKLNRNWVFTELFEEQSVKF